MKSAGWVRGTRAYFDSFNSRSFDDHLDIALTGQANSATLAESGESRPI